MLIPQPVRSSGGGSPGGSDTQIQYNNAGAFGGADGFTFSNSTNAVAIDTKGASFSTGDIGSNYNSTTITLDDSASTIIARADVGMEFRSRAPIQLGDTTGSVNSSIWKIDDNTQRTTSNVKHETTGYITIDDDTKGFVLKDSGGHYWRLNVSTLGLITTTDLGTSLP